MRAQKPANLIGTLIGVAIELAGFVCLYLGEENDWSKGLHLGLSLSLIVLGGLIVLLASYSGRSKKQLVKKLFVCVLIFAVGAVLTGLLTVVTAGGSGWTPVGFQVVMAGLPLLISLAVCVWYWSKH